MGNGAGECGPFLDLVEYEHFCAILWNLHVFGRQGMGKDVSFQKSIFFAFHRTLKVNLPVDTRRLRQPTVAGVLQEQLITIVICR